MLRALAAAAGVALAAYALRRYKPVETPKLKSILQTLKESIDAAPLRLRGGGGGSGQEKSCPISANAATVANLVSWLGLQVLWTWRCAGPRSALLVGCFGLGVWGYAALWGAYIFPAIYPTLGMPSFLLGYTPPLMIYMYQLLCTPFGAKLASGIPYSELLLASAYRFFMEIPFLMKLKKGELPPAFGTPFHKAASPYTLTVCGKTFTFSTGVTIDGIASLVLAPVLALWAHFGTVPASILLGYQAFGASTLLAVVFTLISNLPAPNPLRVWDMKPDTSSFLVFPAIAQAYAASQTGWIVNALVIRKVMGF